MCQNNEELMKAISKTKTFKSRLDKKNNFCEFGEKYYYILNVTYGFIIGVIIDQILVGTFGYPIRLLKKFGRTLYYKQIRLNKYTNNWFIKGFLE